MNAKITGGLTMKKALKFLGGLFAAVFIIIVIALIVDISNDDEQEEVQSVEEVNNEESTVEDPAEEPIQEDKTEPEKKTISWKEKVKEVAASTGTETEKFDEISLFANAYEANEEEIAEFEEYIIKEYKGGKYIMDISNHVYMLGNIFKSAVIENYYDDAEQKLMDSFAFDFLQNSKYNYRKIENMTSESTLSNEEQMDKALVEMGK